MARFYVLLATLLVCSLPILLGIVFSYGDLGFYFVEVVRQFRAAAADWNWLWVKDLSAGYPLLANPQFNPIYLPDWLSLIPGSAMRSLTLNIMFHAWIGWIGFYVWARERECSRTVAIWAGFLFAFHGAAASLQSMLDNFQFMVWIPWCVWAWARLSTSHPHRVFVLWGVAIFAIGAGEPQGCLVAGVLALPWIVFDPERSRPGLVALIAALLVQPWLIPFLEGVLVGDRAHGIRSMFDRPWVLNVELLFTQLSPSSLQAFSGANWADGDRANWLQSLFVGGIASFVWLTTWRTWAIRVRLTLGLQLALAYLATQSLPGASWVLENLPPFSVIRYPSRYVAFFPVLTLFLAVELLRGKDWSLWKVPLRSLLIALSAFLVAMAFALVFHGLLTDPSGAYFEWILTIGSDVGIFACIASLFILGAVRENRKIVLLALIFDMSWVGATYCRLTPWVSEYRLVPESFPNAMGFGEGRWLDLSGPSTLRWGARPRKSDDKFPSFPSDTSKMRPLAPVFSKRPFVLPEYRNVWNTTFVMRPRGTSVVASNAYLLSLKEYENIAWHAGIDYSLSAAKMRGGPWISPFTNYPGEFVGGFAHLGYWMMVRRHESIPEVFMYSVVDSSEEYERAFVMDPRIQPVAMIDSGKCVNSGRVGNGYSWKQLSATHWVVNIQAGSGVLVLAQEAYPGWKALVDGHAREVFRVNGIQMGACIDTTVKRVEFLYRPWWLYILPFQILIGILLVPFWGGGGRSASLASSPEYS